MLVRGEEHVPGAFLFMWEHDFFVQNHMCSVSIVEVFFGLSRYISARLIRCGHHNWVVVLTTYPGSGSSSLYLVDPHIDGKVIEIPTR